MTVEQLLDTPPAALAALSDAELTALVTPLFLSPGRRISARTNTIMVGDRKVQKRFFQNKEKMIETLLKQKGFNV